MADRDRIEQLDTAVEALLGRSGESAAADVEVVQLLAVARELRYLPRAEFRARLKSELERKAMPTASSTKPAGKQLHTVTPYLVVDRPDEFVAFLSQAFGAEEIFRAPGSAGGTHIQLQLGDSPLMAGGAPGHPGRPIAIHLYVPDADAVYQRALAAGATSFYEPMDQGYGDREAGVRDGFGNSWYIATHKATGHLRPGLRMVTPTLHPRGADSLMDFMKRGLGAKELDCTRLPDGMVMHASLHVGDSVVEVGEARGPIEPTAGMLYLSVDDADAWYRRALEAGATSVELPADQPYGERRGGVKDAHGNLWYFSTPITRSKA